MEVISDIDELLDWFREVESQIREAEPPSADPDVIRVQLKEHKALNDDISSQKGRVRDVLSTAKKVLRESSQNEDTSAIREKAEDLREAMDTVSALSSDRLSALEQALPLAEHFHETHAGLSAWMDDMEQQAAMLSLPALRPDLIAQQQDRNEVSHSLLKLLSCLYAMPFSFLFCNKSKTLNYNSYHMANNKSLMVYINPLV
jgi:dystonin